VTLHEEISSVEIEAQFPHGAYVRAPRVVVKAKMDRVPIRKRQSRLQILQAIIDEYVGLNL